MPRSALLESWAGKVPPAFRFSLKASRRISHFKRLKDAAEETRYFVDTAQILGPRLGVILFQLPPNARKDLDALDGFLSGALPPGTPAAFEFRHDSWLSDDVFERLRRSGCALCIADTDEGRTPFTPTADWGYLRLRGTAYSDDDLREWAGRIRGAGWKHAFVFFKHEDEATGPLMAMRFRELAGS
jgi:uncharacterized protein YecE (DUF72 family)